MWITHYYNGIMIAYDLLCDCDKVHLCKAASAQTPRASAPLIKVERALPNTLTISRSSQRLMAPITQDGFLMLLERILLPYISESKFVLSVVYFMWAHILI